MKAGGWRALWLMLLAPALVGCAGLSELQREQAVHVATEAREVTVQCDQPETACARPSPLRALGVQAHAQSAPGAPRHNVLLLDYGQDALLSRLDLIRGAQRSIDMQTYIFDEDDAGRLLIDELLAAARRGVRVRLLVDQLSALRHVDTLAALASSHVNFQMRIYNPVLGRARLSYPRYVLAAACCWRQLNRRMHNKEFLIDGVVGITGGRNYQDRYFDWDDSYNFRDRDILVGGPVTAEMAENFEAFWHSRRAVPLAELSDVARHLLRHGPSPLPAAGFRMPQRVAAISRDADDARLVHERLVDAVIPVGEVEFIADPPDKHRSAWEEDAPATVRLREIIEGAQEEVLLQTPYLVLSQPARQMFRDLHAREDGPRVVVSTNSLAATDAFIIYAMSYKYRRRHLRDFGFQIFEYKPFPGDAPVDVDATGAVDIAWNPDGTVEIQPRDGKPDVTVAPQQADGQEQWQGRGGAPAPARTPLEREYSALRWAGIGVNDPVPLRRAGVRVGLHSKSLVVDERIGIVGTHNFDPRGDNLNTESAVIIDDPRFARALAESIRRDTAPENSWAIAPRDRPPVLSGLGYSLNKAFEHMPILDFWPRRYATSYQFVPGPDCPEPPLPREAGFRDCHEPVGDFPEVNMGWRSILTRITTAFGAGLVPIL